MVSPGHPSVLAEADGVYAEPLRRRVRAFVAGRTVLDSTRAQLVWEHRRYPYYYLPPQDVADGLLHPSGSTLDGGSLGPVRLFDLIVDDQRRPGAAWSHPELTPAHLRDHLRFDWQALDAWFDEETEVFVHPRDPYVRIDVLDTARQVEVRIGGRPIASSVNARLLHESGLPPRLYLPRGDLDPAVLVPSGTVTECPYKGWARHWHARVDEVLVPDVAWCYEAPLPEVGAVGGRVSFYPERVELLVDGERWS